MLARNKRFTMKLNALALLLCAGFVAACGDDDKPSDVKTGTFMNGAVSGLRYSTATQNGLTDAQGRFAYKEGETVAFSIGAVKLGETAAADTVSPFTLLGITPTTDPSVIDFMTIDPTITPEDRAMNMVALLMVLDADATPSNGIDLAGRDEQLANIGISFEHKHTQFIYGQLEQLPARVGNVSSRVDLSAVLAYMYPALGIDVAGPALVRLDRDIATPGDNDSSLQLTSDASGNVTRLATKKSDVENAVVYEYVRDSGGRITTQRRSYSPRPTGGNETVRTFTWTYNAQGQPVTFTETLANGDAAPVTQSETTSTYDANGRLERTVDTKPDVRTTTTYSYAPDDRTLVRLTELSRADVVDDRSRSTTTYDSNGNEIVRVAETDFPPDGVYDSQTTITTTFDALNKQTATTINQLANGIGSRTDIAVTYDASGRVVERTQTAGADAPLSGALYAELYSYANGRIASHVSEVREPGTEPRRTMLLTYAFTSEGRIARWTRESYDGDGNTTGETNVYTYDASGRLTTRAFGLPGSAPNVHTYAYADGVNPLVAFIGPSLSE